MYDIDTGVAEMDTPRRPLRWDRFRADEAQRVIRERCRRTENIVFSNHAFDRVAQRSILREDVYTIIESGHVEGQPVFEKGAWKVIVTKRMPGTREAGAVTLIVSDDDFVFVKTVEWMDPRR